MISVLGSCLGARGKLGRREVLRLGSLGLLGLGWPEFVRPGSEARAWGGGGPSFGRARSCLVLWVKGGPSQLDMVDLKPDAPAEVRGEFRPIATAAPGLWFCEHLPLLARRARWLTVVRSLSHDDTNHASAAYQMTTGFAYPRALNLANESTREDHPHWGSAMAAVGATSGSRRSAAPFVMVPGYLVVNGEHRAGQHAGALGSRFDPVVGVIDPARGDLLPADPGLTLPVTAARARQRLGLRGELQRLRGGLVSGPAEGEFEAAYEAAATLLQAGALGRAFNLGAEAEETRQRYGMNLWGQSVLLGRRLIEAGVRLVHVNWVAVAPDLGWDTHTHNFEQLRTILLPRLDAAVSALLDDLAARGLLEETLVVLAGEFGRTPRVNKDAGRDHWSSAFSAILAGAGIGGGRAFGSTDRLGASVTDGRMAPADLAATVYHALGLDHEAVVTSTLGRPWRVCEGRPVLELWA